MLKQLRRLASGIVNFFNKYKLLIGIVGGFLLVYLGHFGLVYTSTNDFCMVCHVHPQATYSWKKSTHFKNKSGIVTGCVECHLPPGGIHYIYEKARLGIRDAWGTVFKDPEEIDWEGKSTLAHAVSHTFDSSCVKCHSDLYSFDLTVKGIQAHEHYLAHTDEVRCINCHLTVGHYHEKPPEMAMLMEEEEPEPREIKRLPAALSGVALADYTEIIPDSKTVFDMIALPGGKFTMGSPESEAYRRPDEGPQRQVKVSSFWMGQTEVTWREYEVYYMSTVSRGKNVTQEEADADMDALTGPTPPYGDPGQGWGRGSRPAITMTYFGAVRYCEWLSSVTGRKYRLPTEAEWEYACRAGSEGPYYFEGDPRKFSHRRWLSKFVGVDTSLIAGQVLYQENSGGRTHPPYLTGANPWGLYNMLGNVREFCLDWYDPMTYSRYPADRTIEDPTGPESGDEHVVRGGSFADDAADLRSTARDHTRHDAWLVTDPQLPKSIWWYSDVSDVGFRVVREYEGPEYND